MSRLLIILIGFVLVSVPLEGVNATEQRVALVIGNSNYMDAPLTLEQNYGLDPEWTANKKVI